jgi:hypothetical protein
MKMSKLLPYVLLGGGFFLLISRKKKAPSDLSAAAFASNAAISAAASAAKPGQAAAAARGEASSQLKDLTQEMTAQAVKGYRVGEASLVPPSTNVAPFGKSHPPLPYQFAVLYSLSPDLAKLLTPEALWPVYAKGIVKNPTLLKLAEETSVEKKVINALALLSPQRQRMFAAKCAFRSAQLFDVEAFKGTNAKQLALDAVNTVRARADQKISAAEMEALNKPRLKQLRELSLRKGKPAFAELAIDAIERASGTSAEATTAEEKRVSHYLDMLLSVEKSGGAQVALAHEATYRTKFAEDVPRLSTSQASKGASEAAEKAARNVERKTEVEFLEKLLREL